MSILTIEELESIKINAKSVRDNLLDEFSVSIKNDLPFDVIDDRYELLIRSQKQWLLAYDAHLIHKI